MNAKTLDRARRIGEVANQMDALQAELDLLLNEKSRTAGSKSYARRSAASNNGATARKARPARKTKVAKALKSWRKDNGHTLKEAAKIFGVSDATFSHWEHGKNEPKGENANKVKELLLAAVGSHS